MSCNFEDCDKKKIMARGMCSTHYIRWWRHGGADIVAFNRNVKSAIELDDNFWNRVDEHMSERFSV